MKCLSPISVKMPDDTRMLVPCGKCIICAENKQREWALRNFFELKDSVSALFVTLTYDDEHLPKNSEGLPILCKKDIQDFFKRFRHIYQVRYFGCGEYGLTTARPHYHLILYFDFPITSKSRMYDDILNTWQNGKIMIADVNDNRVFYCAKYCIKSAFNTLLKDVYDDNPELYDRFSYLLSYHAPFVVSSRRPPIGNRILSQKEVLSMYQRPYVVFNGYKYALPRLFRDKVFNDLQKKFIREAMPEDYYDFDNEIDVREIYNEKVRKLKMKVKHELL